TPHSRMLPRGARSCDNGAPRDKGGRSIPRITTMDMELVVRASKAFPLQADDRPLYPATGHRQVLERLRQDFAAGHHLTCLIGAPGSGKTALLKALHAGLGADAAL